MIKTNDVGLPVAKNPDAAGPLGRDSIGLEPSAVGIFTVGCVDAVNGEGAREVPDFVPTRTETLEIAKFWIHEFHDTSFWCWAEKASGSSEWRLLGYARLRINRIAKLLGDEVVDRVITEVEDELEKKKGPDVWRMYTEGCEQLRDFLKKSDPGVPE